MDGRGITVSGVTRSAKHPGRLLERISDGASRWMITSRFCGNRMRLIDQLDGQAWVSLDWLRPWPDANEQLYEGWVAETAHPLFVINEDR